MKGVFYVEDKKVVNRIRTYNILFCFLTCVVLGVIFLTDILVEFPIWTLRCLSALYVVTNLLVFWQNAFRDADRGYWRSDSQMKFQTKVKKYFRAFSFVIYSIVVFYVVPVLLGAPLLTNVSETAHFSILLTSIITFPGCLLFGCDEQKWMNLILGSGPQSSWENNWIKQTTFIIVGAWLGAFVIPLDWDRPWQVWPICCTYGALFFCALGHFCNVLHEYNVNSRKGK